MATPAESGSTEPRSALAFMQRRPRAVLVAAALFTIAVAVLRRRAHSESRAAAESPGAEESTGALAAESRDAGGSMDTGGSTGTGAAEPMVALAEAGTNEPRPAPSFLRRHPRGVLVAAALFTIAMAVLGSGVQGALRMGGTTDPAAESSRVAALVSREAPALAPNVVIVVATPAGADTKETKAAGKRLTAVLAGEASARSVLSYWDKSDAALRSADGKHAAVAANLSGDQNAIRAVLRRLDPGLKAAAAPLSLSYAGSIPVRIAIDDRISRDLLKAELIALPITFLLLLLVFRGLSAAILPLLIGVITILTTQAALRLFAAFTDVSVFALNLTTALGLGLAIDYALLIVRRYREERAAGRDHDRALAITMRTAGRAVAYSGLTVTIAIAGLLLFPMYFLRSFAYAGITVVPVSVAGALIVTPAAIAVLRNRIAAPKALIRRGQSRSDPGGWAILARWAGRRAWIVAPVAVLMLLAVALPAAWAHLGSLDEQQLPAGAAARQAQALLNREIPQARAPLAVIAVPPGRDAKTLRAGLDGMPGIAATGSLDTPGGTFILVRSTAVRPLSAGAEHLVSAIRAAVAPGWVGGDTAALIDTKAAVSSRLPLVLPIVILAALIVVFLMTGSLLLPVITVLANGLSLTAMIGAV
ncbi:MAG: MMPL family transporter, partial [Frankiaceae bacterium]|nr:MMPL family transporter [Frankiaceae bacterium]